MRLSLARCAAAFSGAPLSGREYVHGGRLPESRLGAAPDRVELAPDQGCREPVPGGRQRGGGRPAIGRGVVHFVVREYGAPRPSADHVARAIEHGRGQAAAPARHRGPLGPAIGRRVVGFYDIVVAVRIERSPADRVHETAGDGGSEMIARRRDRRRMAPAAGGGVVDRRRSARLRASAPPADDDEPAVHSADARRPAGRRERGPRLPLVAILAVQPETALGHEALLGEPADGVERVAHDGERHVVAWSGEIGDPLPAVRGRIVAKRGGGGPAGTIDPAGNVDLPTQHRGAEFLDRLGQWGGGGPAAVACEEGEPEEKREEDGAYSTVHVPSRASSAPRSATSRPSPKPAARACAYTSAS